MALVECPDCGHHVSDLAPACISCGAPIASPAAPPEVCEVALRLKRDFIGGSLGFAIGSAHWILAAQQMTPAGVVVVASCEFSSNNDIAAYQGSTRGFQQASRKLTDTMLRQGWEPLLSNLGGADIVLPRFQRRASARGRPLQSASGRAGPVAGTGNGGPMSSPADLILKLAELRDSGLITAADFEAKKAELLERM